MMRTNHVKRVMLAAVICILTLTLLACNDQPPPPAMDKGDAPAAKTDPFDGRAPGDKSVPATAEAKTPPPPAKPAITATELGIPFYPGATPYVEPGNPANSSTLGKGINAVLLQTPDAVDKVVAFYQEKLTGPDESGKSSPPSKREENRDGKPTVTLSQINGRTIKAAEVRQGDKITIIELMRMENPPSVKGNLPGNIPLSPDTGGAGVTSGEAGAGASRATSSMSGAQGTPGDPGSNASPPKRSLQYP